MSVLIVDDEQEIRTVLSEELSRVGINAKSVGGGNDAIAEQRSRPADVLVMDMRMPDGDGITASTSIRKFDPDVTIIALSGFRSEYENEAGDLGIRAWISKPLASKGRKQKLLREIREGTVETRIKRMRRIILQCDEARANGPLSPEQLDALVRLVDGRVGNQRDHETEELRLRVAALLISALQAYKGSERLLDRLLSLLASTLPGIDRVVPVFEQGELAIIAQSYLKNYSEFRKLLDRE